MVRVIYEGNLGNNLFQYCFGRILAERLSYKLDAKPIDGFKGTFDAVDGAEYPAEDPIILRGQKPDLSFLESGDPRRHILLTGFFQRAEYYAPYRQSIKQWLATGDLSGVNIGMNDVVLGVRRGRDYIPHHGLPLSYYDEALASLTFERVHICTNEPDDPFVQCLAKRYQATVRPPGALDNLMFIKKFNKIIISNSSFLWWAAFLSEAAEIVFPRPANGYWSKDEPLSKNISLEVDDPRYRYLASKKYRSIFLAEVLQNLRDQTVTNVKRRGVATLRALRLMPQPEAQAYRFAEEPNE